MAVVHVYLIPGRMTRVPDGWCGTCHASSVWTGPVWRLSPSGVDRHGQVTGCPQCDTWTTETPSEAPGPGTIRRAGVGRQPQEP